MADFKTHVGFSTALGFGYAATGIAWGLPIDAALVGGGLCGVSGMLPDIDSDSGIPLRETMSLAAAVVPMLLVDRMQQVGLSYHSMVLAAGAIYLFIRFGVSTMLAKYTVHRGMFHSIPAALVFAGIAFLICGCSDLYLRYFNAGGVFLGVMSHLVLDEIYSLEWSRGRLRQRRSSGTALKLWGRNVWGNLSVYAKLVLVTALILAEPSVMERYGTPHPFALLNQQAEALIPKLKNPEAASPTGPPSLPGDRDAEPRYPYGPQFGPRWETTEPESRIAPTSEPPSQSQPPARDRSIYDTARRFWQSVSQ